MAGYHPKARRGSCPILSITLWLALWWWWSISHVCMYHIATTKNQHHHHHHDGAAAAAIHQPNAVAGKHNNTFSWHEIRCHVPHRNQRGSLFEILHGISGVIHSREMLAVVGTYLSLLCYLLVAVPPCSHYRHHPPPWCIQSYIHTYIYTHVPTYLHTGPSGAGKSCLLDVLCMRKSVGTITGHIKYNGRPLTADALRLFSSYVTQVCIISSQADKKNCIHGWPYTNFSLHPHHACMHHTVQWL